MQYIRNAKHHKGFQQPQCLLCICANYQLVSIASMSDTGQLIQIVELTDYYIKKFFNQLITSLCPCIYYSVSSFFSSTLLLALLSLLCTTNCLYSNAGTEPKLLWTFGGKCFIYTCQHSSSGLFVSGSFPPGTFFPVCLQSLS